MEKLQKAIAWAVEAHSNHYRKFNGMPYISHPIAVMEIVGKYTNDEDILCAAVLHDTVEDTEMTFEEIHQEFGERVEQLVYEVSEPVGKEVDKKYRKKVSHEHFIRGSEAAQLIKAADVLHNSQDIHEGDEEWRKGFIKNKVKLILALEKAPVELKEAVLAKLQA